MSPNTITFENGTLRLPESHEFDLVELTPKRLTKKTVYYVNRNTGKDDNHGLSSEKSLRSIQKVLDLISQIHAGGNAIEINISSGDYRNERILYLPAIAGGKADEEVEGESSPDPTVFYTQVRIIGQSDTLVTGFEIDHPGYYSIENLTVDDLLSEDSGLVISKRSGRIILYNVKFKFNEDNIYNPPFAAEDGGKIYLRGDISFQPTKERTRINEVFRLKRRGLIAADLGFVCDLNYGGINRGKLATIEEDSLLDLQQVRSSNASYTRRKYSVTLRYSTLLTPDTSPSDLFLFPDSTRSFVNNSLILDSDYSYSIINFDAQPFTLSKGSLSSPSTNTWATTLELHNKFFDLDNTIAQLSNNPTVNIETVTADKQLSNDSAHHQELKNITESDIRVLLPENPVPGLSFLIANSPGSTSNLTINSTSVLPDTIYEVRWVGYWKVI